jgi:hypothetical protein
LYEKDVSVSENWSLLQDFYAENIDDHRNPVFDDWAFIIIITIIHGFVVRPLGTSASIGPIVPASENG